MLSRHIGGEGRADCDTGGTERRPLRGEVVQCEGHGRSMCPATTLEVSAR